MQYVVHAHIGRHLQDALGCRQRFPRIDASRNTQAEENVNNACGYVDRKFLRVR